MTATEEYRYSTLTRAVKDKRSPLRRHLDTRFPNTGPVRAAYRAGAGDIVVEGGTADAGTVGTAFDHAVRFALDRAYEPEPVMTAFSGDAVVYSAVLGAVDLAGTAHPSSDDFLQAVWAIALCTEAFRAGLRAGSPLAVLADEGRFTIDGLIGLADNDALAELRALCEVADERMRPKLLEATSLAIGPTFKASKLCAADADLIYDGTLLELKTRLGTKNPKTGTRADVLKLEDLYQLIAYAMFDKDDEFGIRAIGVYSGRYGHFVSWQLQDILDTMTGTTVDLQAERETVWRLLGGV